MENTLNQSQVSFLGFDYKLKQLLPQPEIVKSKISRVGYMKLYSRDEIESIMKSDLFKSLYKETYNEDFPTKENFPNSFPDDNILHCICNKISVKKINIDQNIKIAAKAMFNRFYEENFRRSFKDSKPEFNEEQERIWIILYIGKFYTNAVSSIITAKTELGINKYHNIYKNYLFYKISKIYPEYKKECEYIDSIPMYTNVFSKYFNI